MTQANLLKNAILRNKVETDVSNHVGDITKEIAEQDIKSQAGGLVNSAILPTIITVVNSRTYICTPTSVGAICL